MDPLSGLNDQQRKAVSAPDGPTLVLAGPGSGKTRVLTQRAVYLVQQGVEPRRIMAVTFTNKAAREMRARITQLLGAPGALGPMVVATGRSELRGLTVGTFHSICARILRREAERLPVGHDFVIYDSADQLALVKQAMKLHRIDEKRVSPRRLHSRISNAKNELIHPAEFAADTYFNEIAARVYASYQDLIRANNALDFDDLLMGVADLFREHADVLQRYQRTYQHILVDEFQDTNMAQYTLLRQLSRTHHNLYVVGDPDQSVYRWRGADYRNVRRFQEDHPEALTILLEQNYRSTQPILDAAMQVIDRNTGRTRKELFTKRDSGERPTVHEAYNETEEAQFVVEKIAALTLEEGVEPRDCAVMYRTNAQSRVLEDAFVRASLPYRLVGATRFYARREIKDLIAFLRLIQNPGDTVSLFRVINVPPRGIGSKSIELLRNAAQLAGCGPGEVLQDLAANRAASQYYDMLGKRAARPLESFASMLQHWHSVRSEHTVAQLIDLVLNSIEYRDYILDGSEEGEDRWNNVMELRNVAGEFSETDLSVFLEDVALVSDVDSLDESGEAPNAPTLMTLHAAKGLEFPVVFIVGLDDGVLPHQRSFEDPEAMAEERRLFYVGLTRAKDRVYLSHNFRRTLFGDSGPATISRFLDDIPAAMLTGHVTRRSVPARERAAYRRVTTWERSPRRTPTPPPTELHYRTGQRVTHGQFGEGMVIESKLVGGDELVIIAFESVGIKRLLAELANLTLLEG